MRQTLVIVTQSLDPLNGVVIANEELLPDQAVKVIDLTVGEPDYEMLLKEIFTADSVQTW